MWDSLINIIDRRWKERREPRKRFARAVLALLVSLENCHDCFLDYRDEPSAATLNKWTKSLDALMNTISSIEPILKIFQANLWAVLSWYCWGEFFLEDAARRDEKGYEAELLIERVKSYLATIDLITSHDQNAEYDPDEEEHYFFDLSNESGQQLLKNYHSYLSDSKIDDHSVIGKYRGKLTEVDDKDFVIAISSLRKWIKKEFKPEELLTFSLKTVPN